MSASPIADLTYRGYDGELESPQFRWWVIARMSVRLAFKKKAYWVLTGFSGVYYLIMMLIIFFMEQLSSAGGGAGVPAGQADQALNQFMSRIVWKDQFLHAFSTGQMWFLFLALLLGAGSIANDSRANALLVYLSKPCDKRDYLLGKWMGIFIPLLIAMAIPTAFFWLYGALSYRPYGFLSDDPWVILKLALLLPLGAAFYSSLVVGFSSLFKQGRIAGATLAGAYFITNIFTQLMALSWVFSQNPGGRHRTGADFDAIVNTLRNLYYASIDGVNIGLGKAILGTDGSAYLGIPSPIRSVPAPGLVGLLIVMTLVAALWVYVAWKRIRAVEVVG